MSWELSQVGWLVRQSGSVAVLPWAATCMACRQRSKGGLTSCCGLAICVMCIYGSRPEVCPLCGWAIGHRITGSASRPSAEGGGRSPVP
jgi:hypothetical protein